jgi:hypothetical protein
MDDLDEILRLNPKAAEGIDSIKGAIKALAKLRKAGIARGTPTLMPPHSGRYSFEGLPRPMRRIVKSSK